jgi:hypothetical protein
MKSILGFKLKKNAFFLNLHLTETSFDFEQSTQSYIPEDRTLLTL